MLHAYFWSCVFAFAVFSVLYAFAWHAGMLESLVNECVAAFAKSNREAQERTGRPLFT